MSRCSSPNSYSKHTRPLKWLRRIFFSRKRWYLDTSCCQSKQLCSSSGSETSAAGNNPSFLIMRYVSCRASVLMYHADIFVSGRWLCSNREEKCRSDHRCEFCVRCVFVFRVITASECTIDHSFLLLFLSLCFFIRNTILFIIIILVVGYIKAHKNIKSFGSSDYSSLDPNIWSRHVFLPLPLLHRPEWLYIRKIHWSFFPFSCSNFVFDFFAVVRVWEKDDTHTRILCLCSRTSSKSIYSSPFSVWSFVSPFHISTILWSDHDGVSFCRNIHCNVQLSRPYVHM